MGTFLSGRTALIAVGALILGMLVGVTVTPAAQAANGPECTFQIAPSGSDDSAVLGALLDDSLTAAQGNCPDGVTVTLGVTDDTYQYALPAQVSWSTDETLAITGTEDDTPAILVAADNARILNVSTGAGAGTGPKSISLTNIGFEGGKGLGGGAIQSDDSTIIDLLRTVFRNNAAVNQEWGGAIRAFTGKVVATDSLFEGNTADQSGAIHAANIVVRGSRFVGNSSGCCGGALQNQEYNSSGTAFEAGMDVGPDSQGNPTVFEGNTAASGGAIYVWDPTGDVHIEADFLRNRASNGVGGAVYTDVGGGNRLTLSIANSSFTDDSSTDEGGAIYSNQDLTISDSVFSGSSSDSKDGGAVYAENAVVISSSEFRNSISSGKGGAVYADGGGEVTITGSTFEDDTAGISGGAVYAKAPLLLTGTDFRRNTALGTSGGAVYGDDTVTAEDGIFEDNSLAPATGAAYGGAVHAAGVAVIRDDTFTANSATSSDDWASGGAVYSPVAFDVRRSRFVDNEAASQGANGSYGGALGTEITDNLSDVRDSSFESNIASGYSDLYGGAISSDSPLHVTRSHFTNNWALDVDGNLSQTLYGGAIYANDELTVTDSDFHGNEARGGIDGGASSIGGAIFNYSAEATLIENSVFASNVADGDGDAEGGAVTAYGPLELTDDTFTSNTAVSDAGDAWGGAVSASASLSMSRSVLRDNQADGDTRGHGGAVNVDETVVIDSSEFRNSVSSGEGGAVYADGGGEVAITDSTFEDDTAGANGGAVYAKAPLLLTGTDFRRNRAMGTSGGAVYGDDTVTAENGVFDSNSVLPAAGQALGGAIYAAGVAVLRDDTFTLNNAQSVNSWAAGGGVYSPLLFDVRRSYFADNEATSQEPTSFAKGAALTTETSHQASDVRDTTFESNVTSASLGVYGGAISTDSPLNVTRSHFLSNAAMDTGSAGNLDNYGGAIFANEDLTVTGSTFSDNRVSAQTDTGSYAAGGAIVNLSAAPTLISNSTFTDNVADGEMYAEGGAVMAYARIELTDDTLVSNVALSHSRDAWGGAVSANGSLEMAQSTFTDNEAVGASHGQGGAVYLLPGTATDALESATNLQFVGNEASEAGGAMYIGNGATLSDSYFTGNYAPKGGAFYVTRDGAGAGGDVTITNVTAFGNRADEGSALYNAVGVTDDSTVAIIASTLDDSVGDDTALVSVAAGGTLRLTGSILNKNGATASPCDGAVGSIDDSGGNLVTVDCDSITNTVLTPGASAKVSDDSLGLLAPQVNRTLPTNQGSTPTMSFLPTSVAINRYTSGCPGSDQRGVPRPQGALCDAGAYEAGGIEGIDDTVASTGTVGVAYAGGSFSASGFGAPGAFTWDDSSTTVPGLVLSSGGILSGVPTTVGTYALTARVVGPVDDSFITRTITISAAPGPGPGPEPAAPSAPRTVTADSGVRSATVSWSAPANSGSYAITQYEVVSNPAGGTCLVAASVSQCDITGLTPGTSYTFTVRALNGAGWSPSSTPSNAVIPFEPPGPVVRIVISGSRGTGSDSGRVYATGESTGLSGQRVQARVRLAGQTSYSNGSTPLVGDDGAFQWQRKTGKKVYLYFTASGVSSNRVIIPAK